MQEALKELLYKMADDQLILGHRHSEWTGFGPFLEEDIAFSSMAQDKIGHSYALFKILHSLGEPEPDKNAFLREVKSFKNSIFTELSNGEYEFSLIRHFLYDYQEALRFELLSGCTYEPLAELAAKIKGELRYHTLHAKVMITRLGKGNEESIVRLQTALNELFPYALGIFEPSVFEPELIANGIFSGEQTLKLRWYDAVREVIAATELVLPTLEASEPVYGGRGGIHTAHLDELLAEMSEVIRIDPNAEW